MTATGVPLARTTTPARRFALLAVASTLVLATAGVLGLAVGSHPVPVRTVLEAIVDFDPTIDHHLIVIRSRLPRTVLALVVGAALGMAGTLMQSVTRNPLADPGLLGVNAGASAAVVVAIAFLGVRTVSGYLWFAFGGAALAAVAVYLLGTARRSAATPARMALAGAALSMVVGAATNAVLLSNEQAFDTFRYWAVGSLQGRGLEITLTVLPFVLGGLVLALALARPLNAMALGDETSRALGTSPARTRASAAVAVVLLAGSATAAAGPIAFIGLAAPHIVRAVVGPDHRYLVPGVLLVSPALLLATDVVGRVAVAPGELQTGVAAAIMGGPLFIALVRSSRMASL